jgi:hypothetical protein
MTPYQIEKACRSPSDVVHVKKEKKVIHNFCCTCRWSAKVSENDKDNHGWWCGKYPTDNTRIKKSANPPVPPKWCPLRGRK